MGGGGDRRDPTGTYCKGYFEYMKQFCPRCGRQTIVAEGTPPLAHYLVRHRKTVFGRAGCTWAGDPNVFRWSEEEYLAHEAAALRAFRV